MSLPAFPSLDPGNDRKDLCIQKKNVSERARRQGESARRARNLEEISERQTEDQLTQKEEIAASNKNYKDS